jgi:hypothetical protein
MANLDYESPLTSLLVLPSHILQPELNPPLTAPNTSHM